MSNPAISDETFSALCDLRFCVVVMSFVHVPLLSGTKTVGKKEEGRNLVFISRLGVLTDCLEVEPVPIRFPLDF